MMFFKKYVQKRIKKFHAQSELVNVILFVDHMLADIIKFIYTRIYVRFSWSQMTAFLIKKRNLDPKIIPQREEGHVRLDGDRKWNIKDCKPLPQVGKLRKKSSLETSEGA
jgi:hypothetical protein